MGFLGVVIEAPSSLGADWVSRDIDSATSSAPRTRFASLIAFVSTIQVNPLLCFPPDAKPSGPPNNWSIIHPALVSDTP